MKYRKVQLEKINQYFIRSRELLRDSSLSIFDIRVERRRFFASKEVRYTIDIQGISIQC
jgi:hypothetical protein